MNEEIHGITNERKTAKNEGENDDSDFLWALYSPYKKSGNFFSILTFLTCIKKDTSVLLQVINIWTS